MQTASLETFCMKCQNPFCGKIKHNVINLSSAAQRVVKGKGKDPLNAMPILAYVS